MHHSPISDVILDKTNKYTLSTSNRLDLNYQYPQYARPDLELKYDLVSNSWRNFPVGGLKPEGMWYAFGDEWIALEKKRRENRKVNKSVYRSVFKLDVNTENFVRISTLGEIVAFNRTYAVSLNSSIINWHAVAERYKGIEIVDYKAHLRQLNWYKSFSLSSGCVWDLSAITSYSKVV